MFTDGKLRPWRESTQPPYSCALPTEVMDHRSSGFKKVINTVCLWVVLPVPGCTLPDLARKFSKELKELGLWVLIHDRKDWFWGSVPPSGPGSNENRVFLSWKFEPQLWGMEGHLW